MLDGGQLVLYDELAELDGVEPRVVQLELNGGQLGHRGALLELNGEQLAPHGGQLGLNDGWVEDGEQLVPCVTEFGEQSGPHDG